MSSFLRKEGDSNPRYGYPYDSLANCWFQPLTHPSPFWKNGLQRNNLSIMTHFKNILSKCGCKSTAFFRLYQIFSTFFFISCIYQHFQVPLQLNNNLI